MASIQAPSAAVIKRRARRKSRVMPTTLGLIVLAGLGWWGWAKTHPAPDPNGAILTTKVSRGDLVETINATGSVTAETGAEVKIGSQLTGTIKDLYADVGSHVNKGQPIAVLDLPDMNAQLRQAEANLQAARTKLLQDESGVNMERTQTSSAVNQSQAALRSAEAKLWSVQAAARQQETQTPTDIQRAQANVAAEQAALSTAKSNLAQVQASANLQIATAQEQLTQAQATEKNSNLNLTRQQTLLAKGYVAQSAVDQAQATETVNQSLVASAQQNVDLVKQKVAADLQSAKDAVTQAQQNLGAANAALAAAKAETYVNVSKQADVRDAQAAVNQSKANLQLAMGNTAQDVLKMQDIQASEAAVKAAQDQVDYWHAQFDKTIIRTPISGTVLQLAMQQGETLAAGLQSPTLVVVCDLNRLEIDAYVDETDIGKVRLGQEADCTVDAFPKKIFKGHVFKIASGSTIQQNVVTYDVSIKIDDPKHQLKPDMTANVTLQVGKRSNVLLVPSEAVHVGVHGSTVSTATMQEGKQVVTPVKVKTGGSDGVNTEIRDGLQEGQVIVLAGGDNGNGRHWGPQNPFGPSNNNKKSGGGGKRGG